MRALTVVPGQSDSARLDDVGEPVLRDGELLVEALAVGVCGTDIDILAGEHGAPPPGRDRLILGHESLGRVLEAPADSSVAVGDLVVGIVRRPDPVPCPACAVGHWDMCRNGQYTERGIKERDGYCSERFELEVDFAIKVPRELGVLGVLVEPASVLAKAWQHIERIGNRASWTPHRLLVTGAGPIGLMAALMGVQRGLEVHVYNRSKDGPKPQLVADLGATYHTDDLPQAAQDADITIECTGVPQLVVETMRHSAAGGIVCLTGVSSGGSALLVDLGELNRNMVLQNDVIFGSVNANREHYEMATAALQRADRGWLERVITRRVPLDAWPEALERKPGDVKTIIDFTL